MKRLDQLRDFRNFLYMCHKYLQLPDPTELQYTVCDDFTSDEDRLLIEAFRYMSKSHIASLWCLWMMYWDTEVKILVMSGGQDRASNFVKFCKSVMELCPFLSHMRPDKKQRAEATSFDISGCLPSHTPSLCAKSVGSQIVGSRADHIICDDVEYNLNSMNATQRAKLSLLSSEVANIISTVGTIRWLGTPQTSSSIYNSLPAKGYLLKKYPIFDRDGVNQEPLRFPNSDIERRRLELGESQFQLHWMLNTDLTDESKYPLHINELIVNEDFTNKICREEYVKTTIPLRIPIAEAKGSDCAYESKFKGYEVPMTKVILALDPAGSGPDEFSWVVAGTRNGYVFILDHGGWDTGLNSAVIRNIQGLIKKYDVNETFVEENYGGPALISLLKANMRGKLTPFKNSKQKEKRIIGTLEPILNQRKLVVKKDFIRDPIMMAQFCNITEEKGSLQHDDRIDVVEMACAALTDNLSINLREIRRSEAEYRMQKELDSMTGNSSNSNWMDN